MLWFQDNPLLFTLTNISLFLAEQHQLILVGWNSKTQDMAEFMPIDFRIIEIKGEKRISGDKHHKMVGVFDVNDRLFADVWEDFLAS